MTVQWDKKKKKGLKSTFRISAPMRARLRYISNKTL